MSIAIDNLASVFSDWYGLDVPTNIIAKILEDEELYIEAETGGIRDTCQREISMFALTNLMNCGRWPVNGDTQEYKDNWNKEFRGKCNLYNIRVNWNE